MKNFLKSKKLKWWAVVPLVLAVCGVTYAVLTSAPASITGNTIQTSTAGMTISTDGQNFGLTFPGFNFANVVPGGAPMPLMGNSIYLKNTGTVALTPKVAVSKQPTNPNNIDLSKVNVILYLTSGGQPQSFTLQSLINGSQSLTDTLAINSTLRYQLQISMDADAVTASSASLSGLDLVFSGTASS